MLPSFSVVARKGLRVTVEDEEEAAIMKDAESIAKKKRSNLFNEKGVPYAPWMVRQVDEDAIAIARELRKFKKKKDAEKLKENEGTVNILEAATSELSGMGLKAKVIDGQVELFWGTSDEDSVKGFVVERKTVGEDWIVVGSYKSDPSLKSKGAFGGTYSFVDLDNGEGEFLYRIVSDQADGSREITCQVGIAVESESQQLQTKIVVGISALLFASFIYVGFALDPIAG